MSVPAVDVVMVAYGSTPSLGRAVEAVLASEGVEVSVIVVDNGSTDGSLKQLPADVTLVDAGSNVGFGGGCNLGVGASSRPLVAFVNPDVVVHRNALRQLAAPLGDESVGITSARVVLLEEPDLLNSSGGAIHFLGLGWADDFRRKASEVVGDRSVMASSGAAMMMRRETFVALGGFTEELFLYHEDAELSLRCRQRGFDVRTISDAVVEHDYEFGRNPGKLYLLERNRLVVVATCYSTRMLLLIAPALIAYEVGMVALAAVQGWPAEKFRGWWWLARHRRWLVDRRHKVQSQRRVPDREIAPLFASRFAGAQVEMPSWVGPGDRLLGAYWRLVSRWL